MIRCFLHLVFIIGFCSAFAGVSLVGTTSTENEAKLKIGKYRSQYKDYSGLRCHARPNTINTDVNTKETRWFPAELIGKSELTNRDLDSVRKDIETNALYLASKLVINRLSQTTYGILDPTETVQTSRGENRAYEMAKGKFMDLCCTSQGEVILERLFDDETITELDSSVIYGAIISIQSLLIFGAQCGLTVQPEQLSSLVSHLKEDGFHGQNSDLTSWDKSSVRGLKYQNDCEPGRQLLAALKRKRTARGAFDLLVKLGAWQEHEDLALLRSGFPLRFNSSEIEAANQAAQSKHDPDSLLGIRRDLRNQKLYTIDGASASEIDDALSVERITGEDGKELLRYWIHIADAERWAPRESVLFEVAKERGTSLYLPYGSIPMLPTTVSTRIMSLRAGTDVCALSLGVELDDDGSIIDSSIVVSPSLVRVRYRLTYDEADEMLEEGMAYSEEWQLGALFSAAALRRELRIRNGSAEGVTKQIPQYSMSVFPDNTAPDGVGVSINVQVSHNGGRNQSAIVESSIDSTSESSAVAPASPSSLLVTGEALGKWKVYNQKQGSEEKTCDLSNTLRLPFRHQQKPDYSSRKREHSIMMDLLNYDVGEGYCHAWYARRFLMPVQITEVPMPHAGLGLSCYVQWTSPIRRFGDLQVHCAVKRFIRRQKVFQMLNSGSPIPTSISSTDLGVDIMSLQRSREAGSPSPPLDADIDYGYRTGLLQAFRRLQRVSQQYWLLEYLRRMKEEYPGKYFDALVLGCTNPSRRQYVIYIYELGFECKYISPGGYLQPGDRFKVIPTIVLPRNGQVTFVRRAD